MMVNKKHAVWILITVALIGVVVYPGVRINITQNETPVGFGYSEVPLYAALRANAPLDQIIQEIQSNPSQLTQPSPPLAAFPLQRAVLFGRCDAVEHLLLDVPKVYTSEYLLEMAMWAIKKKHYDCLKYFEQAEPIDGDANYLSDLGDMLIKHSVNTSP